MSDIEDSLTFKHDRAGLVSLENDTLQIAMPQSDERSLYQQQINVAEKKSNLYSALIVASGIAAIMGVFGIGAILGTASPLFILPAVAFLTVFGAFSVLEGKVTKKISALHRAEKARITKYFTENPNGNKLLLKHHADKLAAEQVRLISALDKVKQGLADMSLALDATTVTPAESANIAAQPAPQAIVLPSSAARPKLKFAIGQSVPSA